MSSSHWTENPQYPAYLVDRAQRVATFLDGCDMTTATPKELLAAMTGAGLDVHDLAPGLWASVIGRWDAERQEQVNKALVAWPAVVAAVNEDVKYNAVVLDGHELLVRFPDGRVAQSVKWGTEWCAEGKPGTTRPTSDVMDDITKALRLMMSVWSNGDQEAITRTHTEAVRSRESWARFCDSLVEQVGSLTLTPHERLERHESLERESFEDWAYIQANGVPGCVTS